jgi:PKD repeat protein
MDKLVSVTAASVKPAAVFTASPTRGPVPLSVQFTDQSTGQVDQWRWDFGDGHTSITRNPQHTYEVIGSYTVSLTVSGPGGSATEKKTDLVTVDRKIEPEAEPIDEEVHFDTAEEAVRNKAWNEMVIAYNPDAAFPRYARQHGLGAPLTDETDVEFEGTAYRLQGFVGGIVFTEVGQWDQIAHVEW